MGNIHKVILFQRGRVEDLWNTKHRNSFLFRLQIGMLVSMLSVTCGENASIPVQIQVLLWWWPSVLSKLHSHFVSVVTATEITYVLLFRKGKCLWSTCLIWSFTTVHAHQEWKSNPLGFILILPKKQCTYPLVFWADAGSKFLICYWKVNNEQTNKPPNKNLSWEIEIHIHFYF